MKFKYIATAIIFASIGLSACDININTGSGEILKIQTNKIKTVKIMIAIMQATIITHRHRITIHHPTITTTMKATMMAMIIVVKLHVRMSLIKLKTTKVIL